MRQVLIRILKFNLGSVWIGFLTLLFNITLGRALLAAAVVGAGYGMWLVRPIFRDAVVAIYAHQRAGEPVPFDADYSMGMPYPPAMTWGVQVNSVWMIEKITGITPYFAFEKISGNPMYPDAAYFLPRVGTSSFTTSGQMHLQTTDTGEWIQLNERHLTDPRWIDERRTLATTVHELIHVQGGVFLAGSSAEFESATTAATTEVLAAMCVFQDKLACGAFWDDIESHALISLASRLPEGIYDIFADLFIRDTDEAFADKKTDRFWADNEAGRQEIREKYGRHPWEERVVPGVIYGRTLNTEIGAREGNGDIVGSYMPYDDTSALLGWRVRLLILLTTFGSEW